MVAPAHFHADIADAPSGARSFVVTTADGVRIRAAVWDGGSAGTFFVFPGRTEYIEKYGRVIEDLARRGYCAVVIDWRGQGLSDRPKPDPFIGHVRNYAEYQADLDAVLGTEIVQALPVPRWLLAHSMGGCIGYRALLNGLDVKGAIFSAPMWGIPLSPFKRPIARVVSAVLPRLRGSPSYAPGGDATPYLNTTEFEGNALTSDRAHFDWIKGQIQSHPELGLGGPSYSWLGASLAEMAKLHAATPIRKPALVFVGSEEEVVSDLAIRQLTKRLPAGKLVGLDNARHEILIETPAHHKRVWEEIDEFLQRHSNGAHT